MTDQPSPQSVEAERALLGGLLQDPGQLLIVRQELDPGHFYRPDHGKLYGLLLAMVDEGMGIDLVTVAARIGPKADAYGGGGYVAELPEHAPSTVNLRYYAGIIVEKARLRQLYELGAGLANAAYGGGPWGAMPAGEIADEWIPRLAELALVRGAKRYAGTLAESWREAEEQRLDRAAGSLRATLTTGFPELDKFAEVLDGDLIVIGGETGMGKSALAQALTMHFATQHGTVYYHSMEMDRLRLARRLASGVLGIPHDQIKSGEFERADDEDLRDRFTARLEGGKWNVHINDRPGVSIDQIATEARALWSRGGLRCVVIDHLHIMRHPKRESRNVAVAETTSRAKELARELNVPVILLSQLTRAAARRGDPRASRNSRVAWWEEVAQPQLADLRDSGAIEQDADLVLFPMHAEKCGVAGMPTAGVILVAKQRDGKLGAVGCHWDGPCMTYRPHGQPLLDGGWMR